MLLTTYGLRPHTIEKILTGKEASTTATEEQSMSNNMDIVVQQDDIDGDASGRDLSGTTVDRDLAVEAEGTSTERCLTDDIEIVLQDDVNDGDAAGRDLQGTTVERNLVGVDGEGTSRELADNQEDTAGFNSGEQDLRGQGADTESMITIDVWEHTTVKNWRISRGLAF